MITLPETMKGLKGGIVLPFQMIEKVDEETQCIISLIVMS